MTLHIHPPALKRARMGMRLQAGCLSGGDRLPRMHPAISWPMAGGRMRLSISSSV